MQGVWSIYTWLYIEIALGRSAEKTKLGDVTMQPSVCCIYMRSAPIFQVLHVSSNAYLFGLKAHDASGSFVRGDPKGQIRVAFQLLLVVCG